MKHLETKEKEDFDRILNEPLPGENRKPTWTDEDEGNDFMTLLNQGG